VTSRTGGGCGIDFSGRPVSESGLIASGDRRATAMTTPGSPGVLGSSAGSSVYRRRRDPTALPL
jgi:hypothetical protein